MYVCSDCTSISISSLSSNSNSPLVHVRDANQEETRLTRWGPDGLGKLGGQHPFSRNSYFLLFFHYQSLDPRCSVPIRVRVQAANQARAIIDINAFKFGTVQRAQKMCVSLPLMELLVALSSSTWATPRGRGRSKAFQEQPSVTLD